MIKLLRKISHKSRFDELSSYSIFWIFAKRLRMLVTYCLLSAIYSKKIFLAKRQSKTVHNSRNSKKVLIIGGGPSANRISLENVLRDQSQNRLDVIVMNWYAVTPLAEHLIPNLYVLSDPIFKPNYDKVLKGKSTKAVWNIINSWKSTKLILPNFWMGSDEFNNQVELYIDDRELISYTKNISPLKPRGYCSLTSSKAIAAAVYLGYEEIFIVGFDSSNTRFRVDRNNKVYELALHASDTIESNDLYLNDYFQNGVSELLYAHSIAFLDVKRCFSKSKVFNIQSDSLLDVFPKVETDYLPWN